MSWSFRTYINLVHHFVFFIQTPTSIRLTKGFMLRPWPACCPSPAFQFNNSTKILKLMFQGSQVLNTSTPEALVHWLLSIQSAGLVGCEQCILCWTFTTCTMIPPFHKNIIGYYMSPSRHGYVNARLLQNSVVGTLYSMHLVVFIKRDSC